MSKMWRMIIVGLRNNTNKSNDSMNKNTTIWRENWKGNKMETPTTLFLIGKKF